VRKILNVPVSIRWVQSMPQYEISKSPWAVDIFIIVMVGQTFLSDNPLFMRLLLETNWQYQAGVV
jgi:hypothetical protein